MKTEEQPTDNDKAPQSDIVRLVAGIVGVLGLLIGLLAVLIGIINWPPERKIILGSALLVVWVIVEIIFLVQRRKRVSKKKLPWLIGLFVDVKKHLDPDSKKYLKNEQIFQSLRWAFASFLVIIMLAGGLDWGEFKLSSILNPPTITPTPTQTLTMTPSSTATLTPSPKPFSDSLYYVIVYDASQNMDETFHGEKKWEVARNLLIEIFNGLNPRAQFNMAVIGGSISTEGVDSCNNPESLSLPSFSSKQDTYNYLINLRPQGGGSFYKAYTLAKNQLQDLPADTARTLIYITGASDTCETEDEWNAIKNLMSISDTTISTFSQIIILDDDGIKSRTLAEQFNSLSDENVNAQAPQSLSDTRTGGVTLINVVKNIITYETEIIASISTAAPAPPITATLTPGGTQGMSPTGVSTNPLPTNPPTVTRTLIPTATRTTAPSVTPSLSSVLYISSPGNGANLNCLADEPCPITVTIQWISEAQAAVQGLYLSVWVKPYPGNSNYLFYSQTPVTHLGNGVWRSDPVYVGQIGDEPGTPFALHAIVTNLPYAAGVQTSPLPAHSKNFSIEVTR